jgi:endonuclease/exonuclease/phosphatase family metal-dependent hydrolase
MARTALAVLFFLAAGATAWAGKAASLRVLTINVWSGLDYRGTISCGEYESPTRREARFEILVRQIKALDPDVVFVQEANGKPARPYCSRLARALGYDQIHQICLAGIKLGWVGIPFNLNEGNGILAKRTLHLEKLDEWKLSGLPGIYSDFGSFHLDETISAVVGRVRVNDVPLYLVCVHLSAGPPDDARLEDSLQVLHEHYGFSEKELKQAEKMQQARLKRRADEARRLVKHLRQLSESSPLIVAGDFNSVPDSRVIRSFIVQSGCFDAFAVQDTTAGATWDPRNNENTALSARRVDARGRKLNAWGALDAVGCSFPSRYDYVFLRPPFQKEDVLQSRVVMDSAGVWREPNGDTLRVHASDHYGVLTDVNLDRVLADAPRETDRVEPCTRKTTEAFPIVMYDTDIGYGFGAKLFARHWLGRTNPPAQTIPGGAGRDGGIRQVDPQQFLRRGE